MLMEKGGKKKESYLHEMKRQNKMKKRFTVLFQTKDQQDNYKASERHLINTVFPRSPRYLGLLKNQATYLGAVIGQMS
ncbi:hypothetical protein Y1Q_0002136 [Alligator mississippiensis]|uniref:Uncharacterized protein n=1 Tax=Alligator mississippiensis TaxID=8496 RepID=A0A151MPR6_ALLMI|nr:hypothetical protein Y1Q_0002136 [Alligator mississippiensis]